MEKGIYYKTDTAEAIECELVVKEKSVYLYLKDAEKKLVIWKLDAGVQCSFDGRSLKATRSLTGEKLECSGDIAHQIYQAWNAPEKKKSESRPLVSYTPFIITGTVILLVAILGYFVFLPWLGRQLVSFIPASLETELGDALSKQYAMQYKTNDSANYYANKFCGRMQFNTVYSLRIEVLESDELNAFALPGGRIFIYTGMLKKIGSYEELAALLGHEASHVIHRHSLKSVLRTAAAGIVISALLGNISGISTWVLSKADEFKELDYSRELETEADDEGYKLMLQNKIDPHGMLRLLQLLKKENTEMPGMMKYLSTHPETEERIKNIEGKKELNSVFSKRQDLDGLFKKLAAACKEGKY